MTSFQIPTEPRKRKAAHFIQQVRSLLQKRVAEGRVRGLTQKKLAEKLGTATSVISRQLNGEENLTLRTLADYAWALDLEIELRMSEMQLPAGSNQAAGPEIRTGSVSFSRTTVWASAPEEIESGGVPQAMTTSGRPANLIASGV